MGDQKQAAMGESLESTRRQKDMASRGQKGEQGAAQWTKVLADPTLGTTICALKCPILQLGQLTDASPWAKH